jgi:DNA/RNA endonuclease YhcR with UshA esterase domain
MVSAVISSFPVDKQGQLTLDFTPGLLDRHMSLRDCIAAGVYQRGLGRVAIDLNQAPGNLSVQLSEDTTRNFSVDSLERYIEKTGDTTPVMYLVEKFLAPEVRPANAKQVQAIKDQMVQMMRQLETLGGA